MKVYKIVDYDNGDVDVVTETRGGGDEKKRRQTSSSPKPKLERTTAHIDLPTTKRMSLEVIPKQPDTPPLIRSESAPRVTSQQTAETYDSALLHKIGLEFFNQAVSEITVAKKPFQTMRNSIDASFMQGQITPSEKEGLLAAADHHEQLLNKFIETVRTHGTFKGTSGSGAKEESIKSVKDWYDAMKEIRFKIELAQSQIDARIKDVLRTGVSRCEDPTHKGKWRCPDPTEIEKVKKETEEWCKNQSACSLPCAKEGSTCKLPKRK